MATIVPAVLLRGISRSSKQSARTLATASRQSNKQLPIHKLSPRTSQLRQFASQPFVNQEATPISKEAAAATSAPVRNPSDLQSGFDDPPNALDPESTQVDWSRSFHGLSSAPFPKEVADILLAPVEMDDVEIKADGILYLPEIKYRRILNKAFGPGGWGLAPRGETIVTSKAVTREYALVALGRLVSVARGEQDYFSPEGIPTAAEGCKSNAMLRCCKDLGVASELWDPRFIRKFITEKTKEVWVEHAISKKKKKLIVRKEDSPQYPWKVSKPSG